MLAPDMSVFEPHNLEEAAEHLTHRASRDAGRPDGLLDCGLLAFAESFGTELAQPLLEARELVLRRGDPRAREMVLEAVPGAAGAREIRRLRTILANRPGASERAAPAMVCIRGQLVIALARPIPCGGRRLAVRMQIDLHPEVVHAAAARSEPSAELLARWAALGHVDPPHSVWTCDVPSWCDADTSCAVEVVPNPSGFNEAMLIAHRGAGRTLVVRCASDGDGTWRPATVLPSGWSYLRGDRTMGMSSPTMPNGAPYPAMHVRIPDDDLFALCAARTWTASLRDSIWLHRRRDFRLLGGSAGFQGENP